jgi:hypothetical protein
VIDPTLLIEQDPAQARVHLKIGYRTRGEGVALLVLIPDPFADRAPIEPLGPHTVVPTGWLFLPETPARCRQLSERVAAWWKARWPKHLCPRCHQGALCAAPWYALQAAEGAGVELPFEDRDVPLVSRDPEHLRRAAVASAPEFRWRPGREELGPPGEARGRAAAARILGVRENASEEEIRAAHRRAILEAHPDRSGPGAHARAAAVNDARDRLLRRS